ncbi:hypothetical protein ACFVHW_04570 [Streptomyces sp. NPDC127110]|uniref:hypothetical protein n=1 Tax=Streptomyces sp. NPDC127110 TaxID=3345362 RepID=UPI00362C23F1
MNITGHVTVCLAPAGTSTLDEDSWTTVGTAADFTSGSDSHHAGEATDDSAAIPTSLSVQSLIQWMPAENLRPLPCLRARGAIEERARLLRIFRLLAEARLQPLVHPCPLPFPARDAT